MPPRARSAPAPQLGQMKPEEVSDGLVLAVAEAVRVGGGDQLAVSADGFQVKRAAALPPAADVSRLVDARSIYTRPLPMDATLDAVREHFEALAPVNCVRMRRHVNSKDFRGSAFVEFSSEAGAAAAVAAPGAFAGAPLRAEPKLGYLARKVEERKAKAGGGSGAHVLGEEAPSDEEAPAFAAANAQYRRADAEMADGEGGAGGSGAAGEEGEEAEEEAEEEAAPPIVPGCLLSYALHDAGTAHVTFALLRAALGGPEGGVSFVEMAPSKQAGVIRFGSPSQAAAALAEFTAKPAEDQVLAGARASCLRARALA